MGEKRLDFSAPLLSVRRHAAKADRRPRSVGSPGLVPFTWEQTPGRPKDLKPPPGRPEPKRAEEERGYGAETFSRNDDSSLDCSDSGCSGGSSDDAERSESFSKDPEVREFMMGRFLPAAKAMATGPLETAASKVPCSSRVRDVNYRRSPVPLPYQHRPDFILKSVYDHVQGKNVSYDDDENEEDSNFSRACGLIPRFCSKSSFLLLNPVLGLKVQGYLPPRSQISSVSDHGSVEHTEDEVIET